MASFLAVGSSTAIAVPLLARPTDAHLQALEWMVMEFSRAPERYSISPWLVTSMLVAMAMESRIREEQRAKAALADPESPGLRSRARGWADCCNARRNWNLLIRSCRRFASSGCKVSERAERSRSGNSPSASWGLSIIEIPRQPHAGCSDSWRSGARLTPRQPEESPGEQALGARCRPVGSSVPTG